MSCLPTCRFRAATPVEMERINVSFHFEHKDKETVGCTGGYCWLPKHLITWSSHALFCYKRS